MSKKLVTICMALAAFAAFAVMPTMASATNKPLLVEETGKALAAGTLIKATNVGVTKMTLPDGTHVECDTAWMTGSLHKNVTGTVEGEVTAAHFTGTGTGSDCTSSLGSLKVTPSTATNGLPWCLRATEEMATDEFRLRGGKCTQAARPIRFSFHSTSLGIECKYQAEQVVGTFKTHPEDALLTVSEQQFNRIESSFFCPASGKLDMSFTLETDNTLKAEPLYIEQ